MKRVLSLPLIAGAVTALIACIVLSSKSGVGEFVGKYASSSRTAPCNFILDPSKKPKLRTFQERRVSRRILGNTPLISGADVDFLLSRKEIEGNSAMLAVLYANCKDARVSKLLEKLPPSNDACLIMSLCPAHPEERLKWIEQLENLAGLDVISRNAKVEALLELGRNSEASMLLREASGLARDSGKTFAAIVDTERELWLMLGESKGEAIELAAQSGVLKNALRSISSGALQLSSGSASEVITEDDRIAYVNQSMESVGVLYESFGGTLPFALSAAIQRTELRTLETLDQEIPYGEQSTVGSRVSELKRLISEGKAVENEILMELRDADSYDLEEYYKVVSDKGFMAAGSWLLRRELSH